MVRDPLTSETLRSTQLLLKAQGDTFISPNSCWSEISILQAFNAGDWLSRWSWHDWCCYLWAMAGSLQRKTKAVESLWHCFTQAFSRAAASQSTPVDPLQSRGHYRTEFPTACKAVFDSFLDYKLL
jgi:hypothetical protein